MQASAAISSNCGPGAFGILYFLKSNKSYNLASFFDVVTDEEEHAHIDETYDTYDELSMESDDEAYDDTDTYDVTQAYDNDAVQERIEEPAEEPVHERKWYNDITCIDTEAAIKNSGSEDAFKAVLDIFYKSIPEKHSELEKNYKNGDWENYMIKIHALKSSARLVGAMELGEKAELLENAGKEGNIQYIQENHSSVMEDYLSYKEALASVFMEAEDDGDGSGKPVADDFVMESIYDELRRAADDMDCDMVQAILKEADEYTLPESEQEKFLHIREKAKNYDYDGILEALG